MYAVLYGFWRFLSCGLLVTFVAVQDSGLIDVLKWGKWRRDTKQPPRGWLRGNHHPTPADYARVFPVNDIDWHALANPPGRLGLHCRPRP